MFSPALLYASIQGNAKAWTNPTSLPEQRQYHARHRSQLPRLLQGSSRFPIALTTFRDSHHHWSLPSAGKCSTRVCCPPDSRRLHQSPCNTNNNLHDCIAYTTVWPSILPGGGKALLQSCLQDPLLMDATLARLAKVLMARTQNQENIQLLCETQSRIIPQIREDVAKKRFTDTVLTTMMTISADTAYDPTAQGNLKLFATGFIVKLGALEVHGCLTYDARQYDLYKRLLIERGGIDSFVVPNNREYVLMMDLLHVSRTLSKPNFELPRLYQDAISFRLAEARSLDLEVDAFGVAAGNLKEALLDTKLVCSLFDQFVSRPSATLGAIVSYRNLLLYRLLSLTSDVPAEEICRLAMLVVAFGSTYPMPLLEPSRIAAHALAARVVDPAYTRDKDDAFLFWACMLGMMAAATCGGVNPAEMAYRQPLTSLITRLQLKTWEEARTLLRRYIWPEAICDGGGLTIWLRCMAGVPSGLIT